MENFDKEFQYPESIRLLVTLGFAIFLSLFLYTIIASVKIFEIETYTNAVASAQSITISIPQ